MTAPNNQPLSREDKDRFKAYYKANNGWGPLSLVLKSSANVKDSHVAHCELTATRHGDEEGFALAKILAGMSKSQRIKLGQQIG